MNRTRLCDYKILYRVKHTGGSVKLSGFDFHPSGYVPTLEFERYIVLKETPHTYLVAELFYQWLEDGDFFDPLQDCIHGQQKRFYKTAKKRFAWETKEAAMSDFAGRQRWRKTRLLQELEECEAIIRKAELYHHGDDRNNGY